MKNRRAVRLVFSNIQKEDILNGDCIFVKDEVGQVIPYKNPLRNLELEGLKQDSVKLKQIREKLLYEQGFVYNDKDEVVPLDGKQLVKVGGKNNDKH